MRKVHGRIWQCSARSMVLGDAWQRFEYCASPELALSDQWRSITNGSLVTIALDEQQTIIAVELHHDGRELAFTPAAETSRFVQRGVAETLKKRQQILRRIRDHFEREDFLEVETPNVVFSPGLDLHLSALGTSDDAGTTHGYLNTSPEYHMKRLLVGGVPRCFQFARCFRTGEAGSRHQLEFTMLEFYRTWGSWEHLLGDVEAVVRAAFGAAAAQERFGDEKFDAVTVREAFARWSPEVADPMALAGQNEQEYFRLLSEKIEPQLGLDRPVFLTHFAAPHASLSQLCADDPSVCLRAELYYRGVELSNGFVELTDPVEQRKRLHRDHQSRVELGLGNYPIDESFLRALEEGLPPTVGTAMGLDRLVGVVLEKANIADVIAFPREA